MKVENYIQVKRCKGKAQGGCGELFEKNDTNFFVFKKLNRSGSIRLEYSPRCRACHREFCKAASRKRAGWPSKAELKHTGPKGVEKLFFCTLQPTPLSIEMRAA